MRSVLFAAVAWLAEGTTTAMPDWMQFAAEITTPIPGEFAPILGQPVDWTASRSLLGKIETLIDAIRLVGGEGPHLDIDEPEESSMGNFLVGMELSRSDTGIVLQPMFLKPETDADAAKSLPRKRKRYEDEVDFDEIDFDHDLPPMSVKFANSLSGDASMMEPLVNDYKFRSFINDTAISVPVYFLSPPTVLRDVASLPDHLATEAVVAHPARVAGVRARFVLQGTHSSTLEVMAENAGFLADPIDRIKTLLTVTFRALEKLERLHDRGVVHGGISASSIAVEDEVFEVEDLDETEVILIDFEHASFFPDAREGYNGRRGVLLSSPWQLLGAPAGPRDDVFALIETLAELLSDGHLRRSMATHVHANINALGPDPDIQTVHTMQRRAALQFKAQGAYFSHSIAHATRGRPDIDPAMAGRADEILERIVNALRGLNSPQDRVPYEAIRNILAEIHRSF